MKQYIYLILILFLFQGCMNTPIVPKQNNIKVRKLENLIISLHVDKKEAKDLAKKTIIRSETLAREYNLVRPPLFQNFLVNVGLRKKGLCWQFAFDMLSFVKKQNYKSFDYYIGGANIGNYWREHNVLVLTCKGCSFKDGILLDPWRNSGNLYFSKLKNDKDYIWSKRGDIR